jgi:hypothetical protein
MGPRQQLNEWSTAPGGPPSTRSSPAASSHGPRTTSDVVAALRSMHGPPRIDGEMRPDAPRRLTVDLRTKRAFPLPSSNTDAPCPNRDSSMCAMPPHTASRAAPHTSGSTRLSNGSEALSIWQEGCAKAFDVAASSSRLRRSRTRTIRASQGRFIVRGAPTMSDVVRGPCEEAAGEDLVERGPPGAVGQCSADWAAPSGAAVSRGRHRSDELGGRGFVPRRSPRHAVSALIETRSSPAASSPAPSTSAPSFSRRPRRSSTAPPPTHSLFAHRPPPRQ